jgi:hypothetical protein
MSGQTTLTSTAIADLNFRTKMAELIINALLLVAAFAWASAFESLINYYVPEKYRNANNAYYKLFYAFCLSLLVLIIISVVLHINNKLGTIIKY